MAVRRATQLDPAIEAMRVPKTQREAEMKEEARENKREGEKESVFQFLKQNSIVVVRLVLALKAPLRVNVAHERAMVTKGVWFVRGGSNYRVGPCIAPHYSNV